MIKDANQLFTLSEELFDAVPTPKTRSFRFRMSTCHRTSARTFEAEKRDAQNERMVARDELGQSQAVEEGGENRLLEAVVSNGELGETLLYGEKENEHARLMEKSVALAEEPHASPVAVYRKRVLPQGDDAGSGRLQWRGVAT